MVKLIGISKIVAELSEAQRFVLLYAYDRGSKFFVGGKGNVSRNTAYALQRKGLVYADNRNESVKADRLFRLNADGVAVAFRLAKERQGTNA